MVPGLAPPRDESPCPLPKELWKAIDYLKEEVRVLKEQQAKDKRTLLNDGQQELPPRSPDLNTHAERLVRAVKEECLDRIIEPQHEGNQGKIVCVKRPGGRLKSYHRKAA